MDINSVQSLGEDPQKLKGVYFYDGKLYACIGSMGSQVEGIIEVNCYVVVPSAEYTGKKITHKDLSPAGYAGMSGTYKGVEYTLTGDEIRFQPKKEAQPAADVTKGVNPVSKAPETETKPAQTVNNPPVSETVVPKPATTAAATGEVAYWLKDGRGPFENVQVAMDAMGLDKATRPAHNRWDRLSTALKEQILRKPKA